LTFIRQRGADSVDTLRGVNANRTVSCTLFELKAVEMYEKTAQFRSQFYSQRSLRPWIYLSVVLHAIFLYALETWRPAPPEINTFRDVIRIAVVMTPKAEAKVIPEKPAPPQKEGVPPQPRKDPPKKPPKPVIKKDPPKRIDPPVKKKSSPVKPTEVAKVPQPKEESPPPPQPPAPAPIATVEKSPDVDSDLPNWYLLQIRNTVVKFWDQPAYKATLQPDAKATVFFEITRKGDIDPDSIRLLGESGYRPLDESALMAIKKTPFFPPLPGVFPKEKLQVRIHFSLVAAA